MLTLFGSKGAGSCAVEAALQIIGAKFRLVDAASWKAEPGLDELKHVNPLAQIPTLVLEDGRILTESAAILIHLGFAFPESGLLPASAGQRAQAIRGLVFIAANCYAAIGIIDYPERFCDNPDEALRKRIIDKTKLRLYEYWDMFADTFSASDSSCPWLSGDKLGALDLLAAVVSRWSGSRAHLARSRPAFHALLARIESEPRVAPIFARHWPAA